MRPVIEDYFLEIAKVVATRSTCLDKQVGCVLVDEHKHIVATGYNGAPAGEVHCNDGIYCAKSKGEPCKAIHAEQNAINHCNGRAVVCYSTLEPCVDCAKALNDIGVKSVYFITPTTKSGRKVFNGEFIHCSVQNLNNSIARIREYHHALGSPTKTRNREDQAREIMLAMFQEVAELTRSFDWKPWKKYHGQPSFDKDNMLEEAGDILFFIDSLLMVYDLTWEQLAFRIDTKVNECTGRLSNGYHD